MTARNWSVFLICLVNSAFSQSPELNTVCYGRSDYHSSSKSTVVYDGHLNVTINNHKCLNWAVDPFKSDKPDHSHVLDESHNFCRGVHVRSGRPWCYIDLEASEFSIRSPSVRKGWDWCKVPHCHHYRTECQRLRDRFDYAEAAYQRSLNSKEVIPNDYCRPICDDNGDFEMEQHCNREFMKTEQPTGGCITWDNNAEDSDFVYNFETQKCEGYTKCRYEKYIGKLVECDENGVEVMFSEIVITEVPNVVTDVTVTDMTATEMTVSVEDMSEENSTIENISLSNEEFEKDEVISVENVTEMVRPVHRNGPKSMKSVEAEVSVIENNLFDSSPSSKDTVVLIPDSDVTVISGSGSMSSEKNDDLISGSGSGSGL